MCSNESNTCYIVDLTITSGFDKDEESFERNRTICSDCKNKIRTVLSKVEDEYFNK
jgi:hypothetical protein